MPAYFLWLFKTTGFRVRGMLKKRAKTTAVYLWFLLLGPLGFCFGAGAYIPSYQLIVRHTAANHGSSGGYRIEQTLTFKTRGQTFLMKEVWRTASGIMHMRAASPRVKKLHLSFLYKGSYKRFKSPSGRIQKRPLSWFHADRPFYLRSAQSLGRLFYQWKAAPFFKEDDTAPAFGFIRLVRRQGVVQYHIAQNKTGGAVWVEQDEFVIREWNIPAKKNFNMHLTAWDYELYPGGFWFPKHRRLKWKNLEVLFTVQKVKKQPLLAKSLKKHKLSKKNNIPSQLLHVHFDAGVLKEFYQTFR